MSDSTQRLEALFVELGAEGLREHDEAQALIGSDPECAAIFASLGDVDALVAQLPAPDAPQIPVDLAARATSPESETQESPMQAAALPEAQIRQWHVAVEDEQIGPLDDDALKDRIRRGLVGGDDLAWRAGMAEWQPLRTLEDFASLFLDTGNNNRPFPQLSTTTSQPEPTSFTDTEWKPTTAEQLSSLVQDEIDRGDAKEKQPEATPPAGMPALGTTPAFDPEFEPPPGGVSWRPPAPDRGFRLRPMHVVIGAVASSVATVIAVLLAVQVGDVAQLPDPDARSTSTQPALASAPAPQPISTPSAPPAAEASPAVELERAPPSPPKAAKAKARKRRAAPEPKRASADAELDDLVSAGTPVKAKLTPADVKAGVRAGMGAVKRCIASARQKGEIAPGKHTLILDWVIRPNGSVANPRLKGPSYVMGTSLPNCFAKAMRKWRFPASQNGAPVSNFPFGPFTLR